MYEQSGLAEEALDLLLLLLRQLMITAKTMMMVFPDQLIADAISNCHLRLANLQSRYATGDGKSS